MPEMLNNISKTVKDDLTVTMKRGDKLSVPQHVPLFTLIRFRTT